MQKKFISISVISSLLIALFLYAAVSKWREMEDFKAAMYNQPFPAWFATLIIWCLPPLEVIIAILLMIKRTQLAGMIASAALLSLFSLYIGAILLHLFPRVPCSCGGLIKKLGWGNHLLFNLFFIMIALIAVALMKDYRLNFKWVFRRRTDTA